MRKTNRYRAYYRAARAWKAGHPHTAWEIMVKAGLESAWPQFLEACLKAARTNAEVSIRRHSIRSV